MERLGSDGRPLVPEPPASTHRRDISDDDFEDDSGIEWNRRETRGGATAPAGPGEPGIVIGARFKGRSPDADLP